MIDSAPLCGQPQPTSDPNPRKQSDVQARGGVESII